MLLWDDGEWTCRSVPVGEQDYFTYYPVQTTDGRRFFIAVDFYEDEMLVVEADGETTNVRPLPDDLGFFNHLLGLGSATARYAHSLQY